MILKGEKVILRPIKLSDARRFVKWLDDPQVNKFTTLQKISLKEEIAWIENLAKSKDINFAIDTKEKVHIGSIGLHLKLKNRNAVYGILIGDKKYWGGGYGTDATKLILQYGFNKLKLHKITLNVYSYNPRAINLYLDMGFELEGIKKEQIFYQGKFYTEFSMGLLSKKWKKMKKK